MIEIENLRAYVSIGDSMSIDLYPYLDLSGSGDSDIPCEVGAASLLYANADSLYEEFIGRDLKSLAPGIELAKMALDGATTYDYFDREFLKLISKYRDNSLLITVTLGGNDLLALITRSVQVPDNLEGELDNLLLRYDTVINTVEEEFSRGIFILNSVYDPTDGTGELPGFPDFLDKLSLLERLNGHIENLAEEKRFLFADIHKHFYGHGLSAPEENRWYWKQNPIEPSAIGASEIRRLWFDLLLEDGIVSLN